MRTPAPFQFLATVAVRACQLGTAHANTPRDAARLAGDLIRYHRRHVRAMVRRCNGDDASAARLEKLLRLAACDMAPQLDDLALHVSERFSAPRAGQMLDMRARDGSPAIMTSDRDCDSRPSIMIPL